MSQRVSQRDFVFRRTALSAREQVHVDQSVLDVAKPTWLRPR